MPDKPTPELRSAYCTFITIPTRWMDNDVYGHVNNVNYYSYFDTAVNSHLINCGVLDMHHGEVVGFVVENHCNYFSPVAFPQTVTAGVRVTKIGSSSVRYEIGLFADDEQATAAKGHFIHVYVDRVTKRPVALPEALLAVVGALVVGAATDQA